ncbi:protein lin-41-like [Saccostrea cucullata]
MKRKDKYTAMVGRYKSTGQELQHNPCQGQYINPKYITENQNGDVIVSDSSIGYFGSGVVVVTDCKGTHRFSYKGNKPESSFEPRGICTDELLNIIVCDINTKTVQMIDKDGQFLTVLLTEK